MSAPTDTQPVSDPAVSPPPASEQPAAESAPAPGTLGEPAPAPPTPEPAAEATTAMPDPDEQVDVEAILPSAATLTVGGIPCQVERIKMRELMLIAQIISAGPGTRIASLDWSNVTQEQVFAMAMIALPDAEAEVFNFLRAVVRPREKARADELQPHLNNPEPDDFLNIVAVLWLQEREEFERLGKRVRELTKGLQALAVTGKRGT